MEFQAISEGFGSSPKALAAQFGSVHTAALACIPRGEIFHILLAHRRDETGHDRIVSRSAFVVFEALHEIVGMLSAEFGELRGRAIAVRPVARLAKSLRFFPSGIRITGGRYGGGR